MSSRERHGGEERDSCDCLRDCGNQAPAIKWFRKITGGCDPRGLVARSSLITSSDEKKRAIDSESDQARAKLESRKAGQLDIYNEARCCFSRGRTEERLA